MRSFVWPPFPRCGSPGSRLPIGATNRRWRITCIKAALVTGRITFHGNNRIASIKCLRRILKVLGSPSILKYDAYNELWKLHVVEPFWKDPLRGAWAEAGGWFNIKMPSYQFVKSHCGNKSYDSLISTMGFPVLVRHLYIESRPGRLSLQ